MSFSPMLGNIKPSTSCSSFIFRPIVASRSPPGLGPIPIGTALRALAKPAVREGGSTPSETHKTTKNVKLQGMITAPFHNSRIHKKQPYIAFTWMMGTSLASSYISPVQPPQNQEYIPQLLLHIWFCAAHTGLAAEANYSGRYLHPRYLRPHEHAMTSSESSIFVFFFRMCIAK